MRRNEAPKRRGIYEKMPGSGVWWVRYVDGHGKIRREKVGTKSAASDLYTKRKNEVREGIKLPENMKHRGDKVSAIIDRALLWYEEHRPKSYRTAKTHLETIKRALGERMAADLTPHDIDKWLSAHEGWSPATKNRYKATLGRALQREVVNGTLAGNVARLVIARKEQNIRERYLSSEEEKRIVAVIKKKYPSYLPALIVALHTGMRQSEQFSLTWDRVDFDQRKIHLPETKSGKPHVVHMNQTCYNTLKSILKARPKDCETNRVFLSARYKGQLLENPRQWFPDAVADAEITNFHWHDLRHTFASRLVQKGVSLQTVSKLANHSTIAVTMRYAHLASEQLEDAVALLD